MLITILKTLLITLFFAVIYVFMVTGKYKDINIYIHNGYYYLWGILFYAIIDGELLMHII